LWRTTHEAEIAREELGILACHIEKRLPDHFFVACIAHICDQLQELKGIWMSVKGREVVVSKQNCNSSWCKGCGNGLESIRGKLGGVGGEESFDGCYVF